MGAQDRSHSSMLSSDIRRGQERNRDRSFTATRASTFNERQKSWSETRESCRQRPETYSFMPKAREQVRSDAPKDCAGQWERNRRDRERENLEPSGASEAEEVLDPDSGTESSELDCQD